MMLDNCLFGFESLFTNQSWTVYKKTVEKAQPNEINLYFDRAENSSMQQHESFGRINFIEISSRIVQIK
jgi:hypothetical protein